MPDYSAIGQRVVRLLAREETEVDEAGLYDHIDLVVALLLDQWSDLGTYEDITGPDKTFFDWGVALLTFADVYDWVTRSSSDSSSNVNSETGQVVIRRKEGDVETQWSDPSKSLSLSSSSMTLAEQNARRGWEILRRVDAIGYTTPLDTEGVMVIVQPLSLLPNANDPFDSAWPGDLDRTGRTL